MLMKFQHLIRFLLQHNRSIFMIRFFLKFALFAVFGICIFASACKKKDDTVIISDVIAQSMLVNGADTSNLDFYINGTKQTTAAISFGTNSSYFNVKITGSQKTAIAVKSATTALSFADSILMSDKVGYTFFVYRDSNSVKKPGYEIITDDLSVPGAGKSKIRIAHLVNDILTYGLDIESTTSGSKPTARNDLSNLRFKNVSNFVEINKGVQDIIIKVSGTTNIVATISNANLLEGKIYTFVLQGTKANNNLKINSITNL